MSESESVEDVKPPIHFFEHVTTDSKMSLVPALVDLSMKTGEIFRNIDGQYSFMCFNCGLIFEDFGEIISHCETHYQNEKNNVHEFVLSAETGTEQLESCTQLSTESCEPAQVPNESSVLTTSKKSTRRRKKKNAPRLKPDASALPLLNFPQYCPKCGVWCDDFQDHMQNEHNFKGRIFQCFVCKHCFHNTASLRLHLSSNVHNKSSCYCCAMEPPITHPSEPRRHKCLFCKEWYKNHAKFKVHFKEAHNQDADSFFARRKNCNIFTCYVCEKEFPLRYYLTAHMKIHYDKFLRHTCPTCGRRLRTFGQLTQHLKTHEGKIYQCDQCEKQFAHYVRLKLHKRVHVTERNFTCDQCQKSFTLQKYLRVHQAVHTEKKKYRCKFCSATFNFTSGRRAHEKSHHNVL